MARSPNEKAEEAHKLYKRGMKLVEIAAQLNCSAATIRTWKNRYKWDSDSETFQKENETQRNVSRNTQLPKPNDTKAVADEVKQVTQNTDLTDKQQLFCIYYIRCFNATKAYQKAYGCGYTTAVTNGPALLGNARIKEEILQLKQERLNRELLSEADIFQKYMDIAFADVTDFVEFGNEVVDAILDNGERKKVKVNYVNIKKEAAVDGTIISEVFKEKGEVRVKLADRMKALQWLADHMDLATEKQKAEIAALRAKTQNEENTLPADDGFLDALNGTAGEDWSDES